MHTYRKAKGEPLWTVGYFTRCDSGYDVWTALRDFSQEENAAAFAHYLNGGNGDHFVNW
jgi:hypothetical protein